MVRSVIDTWLLSWSEVCVLRLMSGTVVCKSRDYPRVSSTMGTGDPRKVQSEKEGV